MRTRPISVEDEVRGLRFDVSNRHSIRGLTAPDKQRTNECNELNESLRGLIRAGRPLKRSIRVIED